MRVDGRVLVELHAQVHVHAVEDALARGAAPALWKLNGPVGAHPRESEAVKALAKSCSHRLLDGAFLVAHFADASSLHPSRIGWGDDEAHRFAKVIMSGALANVEYLYLDSNAIGEEGMAALAEAVAEGGLTHCDTIVADNNPASCVEVVRALGRAVEKRIIDEREAVLRKAAEEQKAADRAAEKQRVAKEKAEAQAAAEAAAEERRERKAAAAAAKEKEQQAAAAAIGAAADAPAAPPPAPAKG